MKSLKVKNDLSAFKTEGFERLQFDRTILTFKWFSKLIFPEKAIFPKAVSLFGLKHSMNTPKY